MNFHVPCNRLSIHIYKNYYCVLSETSVISPMNYVYTLNSTVVVVKQIHNRVNFFIFKHALG